MADEILNLTSQLYRLTGQFPTKDPLRYKMRDKALDVLADHIKITRARGNSHIGPTISGLKDNIAILHNLFELVKQNSWVKHEDIIELQSRYNQTAARLVALAPSAAKQINEKEESRAGSVPIPATAHTEAKWAPELPPSAKVRSDPTLSAKRRNKASSTELAVRQKKVLKLVQEKRAVKIGELTKNFPGLSRRTVLRDLDKLMRLGLVTKQGNGRGAHYRAKVGSDIA